MSRILILLPIILFSLGFAGCQTASSPPLGNIFASSSTIPPPGTNAYTANSAPPGVLAAATNPPDANPDGVSPFAPNDPYANPHTPSTEDSETAVQPFSQWTAAQVPVETADPSAGSVKVAARTGDEITIPVSAFRTDTGLYSNDSRESQSAGTGTATETMFVGPFQEPK